MKEVFKEIKYRYSKSIKFLIRVIHQIIIFICFSGVYIIGFGITFLVVLLFDRHFLYKDKYAQKSDTYWLNTSDYILDIDNCKLPL